MAPATRTRGDFRSLSLSALGIDIKATSSLHMLLEPALVDLVSPAVGKGRRLAGLVDEQKLDLAWLHHLQLEDDPLCKMSLGAWRRTGKQCILVGRERVVRLSFNAPSAGVTSQQDYISIASVLDCLVCNACSISNVAE